MDETSKAILDEFSGRRSRSRLAPHYDLIRELHRRGCPFKEMSRILEEKFGLAISPSTIFRFLERQEKKRLKSQKARKREENSVPITPALPPLSKKTVSSLPTPDEIRQRITELKQRKSEPEPEVKRFHYDPTQPLHLISET